MRIIVKGISPENFNDWNSKFSSWNLSDSYYSPKKSFLFSNVENYQDFISTFDGIKWKGDTLLVQESIFPPYIPPESINSQEDFKLEIPVESDRFNFIQEKLEKDGWKIGKFNRKIAIFKTRDPKTRKFRIINPENYRNNYFRFSEKDIGFKSVKQITWSISQSSPCGSPCESPCESSDESEQDQPKDQLDHVKDQLEKNELEKVDIPNSETRDTVVINTEYLRSLVFPTCVSANLFDFGQDIVQEPVLQEENVKVLKSFSTTRLFFLHLESINDRSVWDKCIFKRYLYYKFENLEKI